MRIHLGTRNKIILIIVTTMFLGLTGCSKVSLESKLKNHNLDEVIAQCSDYKEEHNNEKLNELKQEIINAYLYILNDFSNKEIEIDDLNTYMDDIKHLKNNYEFLVENDSYFSHDLEKLYASFNALSYSRSKLDLVKSYSIDNDISKINSILESIPLWDNYSVKNIAENFKDTLCTKIPPVELVDYELIQSKYKEEKSSDLKYKIKNNTDSEITQLTLLFIAYDENGTVVSLDYPSNEEFYYMEKDENSYTFSKDKFVSNSIITEMTPFFGDINMNVSMVMYKYNSDWKTEHINDYMYLQLYTIIEKNKIKIPNSSDYYYRIDKEHEN